MTSKEMGVEGEGEGKPWSSVAEFSNSFVRHVIMVVGTIKCVIPKLG